MRTGYSELREQYPEFIYKSFTCENRGETLFVRYHFEIPGLAEFKPELEFPLTGPHALNPPETAVSREILFSVGMVELISYWKTCCPPIVRVKCGALSAEQIAWWKDLYFGGLGEFFYRNGIDAKRDDFMTIVAEGEPEPADGFAFKSSGRNLIPVGGGKDSIVTIEHLASLRDRNLLFGINPSGAALDTMRVAGYGEEQRSKVRRRLDPELLRLNKEGFLNGHTPFSALIAFAAYYCAYLSGASYIILSNEASANAASVAGTEINHQYSKTSEFEIAFRDYTARYLLPEITYFSLMRPFAEIAIAASFASYEQYFPYFRSCNLGSKQNVWCNHCAKCLFVYVILAPFTDKRTLESCFGRELWSADDLLEDFKGLCGILEAKPFECVGTVEEVQYALYLELNRRLDAGEKELPLLLAEALSWAKEGKLSQLVFDEASGRLRSLAPEDPLAVWHKDERVPESFKPLIADIVTEGRQYAQ